MNELIRIEAREIAGTAVQTCNARDLWQFVESRQDFSTWIKGRIDKYGFVEGEDFTVHKFMERENQGLNVGQGRIDYHLTIEMAKELAMVENNEKGRQVRRYFIECERRVKAAPAIPRTLTRNQVAAGILLLRSAAEDLKLAPSAVLGGYQRLEAELGVAGLLPSYAIDAPASSVAGSSEAAKALGDLLEEHGVGMSAIAFNRLLMQCGVIEERERPSSKGGTKKFKVIVDLEYGKNATHPSNPRETQPLWYPSKFVKLLELVMPAKPAVVASPMEAKEVQQ